MEVAAGERSCDTPLADRPTVASRVAPGGASSVCLGGADPQTCTSSNAFAHGANQNSGNVLTDRPTTTVRQSPGGASTICFGDDSQQFKSKDATDTQVACPEVAAGERSHDTPLADRPSVASRAAPGGSSTVCLGGDDQPVITTSTGTRQTPGGASTICFGDDSQQFASDAAKAQSA